MKLTDYLVRPLVKVPIEAKDKTQAITELVDIIAEQGLTQARDLLLEAVLEREAQRTTGIGRGFAIPHAKCDAVKRLVVAFGRAAEPIDFAAVDGQPVSLIALLASPTHDTSTHIQALAKLGRLVTNATVLEGLLSAETGDAFYDLISKEEVEARTA
jgi:fructose-specific phosphotransferase system IIA component